MESLVLLREEMAILHSLQLLHLIDRCHRVASELGELAILHNKRQKRGDKKERRMQGKKVKVIKVLTASVCLLGLPLPSSTDVVLGHTD